MGQKETLQSRPCHQDEIPISVAINEAVELSKKYGADKEASFINGILGGLSRDLEQKNE